jgi:hypothetical protein
MADSKKPKNEKWAKLAGAGLAVVAVIAFLCNATGVINNLIGIASFHHATPSAAAATPQPRMSVSPAEPQVTANPAKPKDNRVAHPQAAAKPVIQFSSGNNSANLNGVQGSVHIQGESQGAPTHTAVPAKRSTTAIKPSPAGVTQISTGDGSPNISNVGGDVDLRYPAPTKNDN